MAIYGVDFLGTEFYGHPRFVQFDATPVTAEPVGYGTLRISWTIPSGEWSHLRVVRNSYGAPDFETDGQILTRPDFPNPEQDGSPEAGTNTIYDRDLQEGRFYYYSVFVLDTSVENNLWRRAGTAIGLTVQDHGLQDVMFRWLPGWFQEQDNALGDERNNPYREGPLKRYLNVIGVAANHVRTDYETERYFRNPDRISGNLLPLVAQQVGVPIEPAIGMRRTRFWTRDAVFLYRRKGTFPGIEGVVTTITGWDCIVRYGRNLLKGVDAAAWVTTDTIEDDLSASDLETGDIATQITGAPWEVSLTPNVSAWRKRFHAIRIEEEVYVLSAEFRALAGSGDVTVAIQWLDEDGEEISTETSLPIAVSDGEWTTASLTEGAPTGTKYANPIFEGTTDVQFRRASLHTGSSEGGGWAPPLMLDILLLPARANLVLNPSFENSLATWSIDGGTFERSSSFSAYHLNYTMHVTGVDNDTAIISGGPYLIENPGLRHTSSVRTTSEDARIRTRWLDDSDDTIETTAWRSPSVDEFNDSWNVLESSSFAPENAASAIIEIECATGDLFDAAMLEQADRAGMYFDGSLFGADYIWAGDAHISASRYYPARAVRNNRLLALLPYYLPLNQKFRLVYVTGESFRSIAEGTTMGIGTLGIISLG